MTRPWSIWHERWGDGSASVPVWTISELRADICCASRRVPSPRELERLEDYLAEQRALFRNDVTAAAQLTGSESEDAAYVVDLAACVSMARVLLNLDEFITRE